MKLSRQTYVLAAIGLLDMVSTVWLLQRHGAAEANPLMARILIYGTGAFIAAKLALLIAPLGILEWARRRRPRFVARAANVAIASYLLLYAVGVARNNMVPDPSTFHGASPLQQKLWAQIQANIRVKRARVRTEAERSPAQSQPAQEAVVSTSLTV